MHVDETEAARARRGVFGTRSRFRPAGDADVLATFEDGSRAAVTRPVGKGSTYFCGFLPGLTYFKPAIPPRPVDRGSTDDTMAHFIPTKFDRLSATLVAMPASEVERPVVCSEALVETTVIEAKQGAVIPLVNWSAGPVKGLTVEVSISVPTAKVTLASGRPVKVDKKSGKHVFTLDLDVADALILR
jgi:hypothetical protein